MKKCVSGKKAYLTYEMAEEALIDAHIVYDYGRASGPVAVYQCDDCGQYHLTSSGKINARLEQMMADGTLDKMRRAKQWDNRFR